MGIEGISGGGMRAFQAWQMRREVKQVADPDPQQFADLVADVPDTEAQGPMSGSAALEYSRRIEELRKTTVPEVSEIAQAGMSQHNFVNLELQTLPTLRPDDNQIKPRDLRAMLDS